jgi:hypothetical protein
MTPEERDRFTLRLLGAWPTPRMADETLLVWAEHLNKMEYAQAMAALVALEGTSKHRPSLADVHEQYNAEASRFPKRTLPGSQCGVCDDGWIETRCNTRTHDCTCGPDFTENGDRCPFGFATSARCPNGCKPMSAEARQERDRAEAFAARRRSQQSDLDRRLIAERHRDWSMPEREEVF